MELGSPELRMVPDRVRLADAGIDARTLGLTLDAFNDGVRIDEITVGSERIDLMLKGRAAFAETARTRQYHVFPSSKSDWSVNEVFVTSKPASFHEVYVRLLTEVKSLCVSS